LAAAVGDYLAALVKLFEIMDEAPEEQARRMLEEAVRQERLSGQGPRCSWHNPFQPETRVSGAAKSSDGA